MSRQCALTGNVVFSIIEQSKAWTLSSAECDTVMAQTSELY